MIDVLGIGFGPSNLSLAIQLKELAFFNDKKVRFFEKKKSFSWQPGLLLPNTNLQIHFLKDLVTLINPKSPFTFINYLKEQGRLSDFINLNVSYPSRMEFNDYLFWAANKFEDIVSYNSYITDIEPKYNGNQVSHFKVTYVHDNIPNEIETRHLVIASGRSPKIPSAFFQIYDGINVIHSDQFTKSEVHKIASENNLKDHKIAIIGAGQSAAEIFLYLLESKNPNLKVVNFIRQFGYSPADSSSFRNKVFDPDFVDVFYNLPSEAKNNILESLLNTNYSVVDPDLISKIFTKLYHMQHFDRSNNGAIVSLSEIKNVIRNSENKIEIEYSSKINSKVEKQEFDYIVLATGFEQAFLYKKYFNKFKDIIQYGNDSNLEVNRDYSIKFKKCSEAKLFLQGYSEMNHGIADTLLSVMANRAFTIATSLIGGNKN
ncbi:ornithine monooxygenase [Leptospira levettii]|uniref:SidA/IucD/PvdA family monooxygenase n=1 Tax=Leptospira levettii TaxID=2023178 RepID=UPI001083878B|nr:SidA/IucD/PvdA family monooxygenase [Leptospira levettii]TGM44679.1 ornithine monooxygenase [Leptospira levettii]TGM69128.1 ornithine monooxygenase [Leptospira levettii]TGM75963.1 ornithine monooxygenase [Leptospira levettii]